MTPELLQTALARALTGIAAARGIDSDHVPKSTLRRTREQSSGTWVSTMALRCAAIMHTEAKTLAEQLAAQLRTDAAVTEVEVTGSGFLNITVDPGHLAQVAADIVGADQTFGPDREIQVRLAATVSERLAASRELQDLRHAVGDDAPRYFAARGTMTTSTRTGTDLLRAAHPDNPVYFVQVAHAAACRIERRAASAGCIETCDFDPQALTDDTETALAAALADFVSTTRRAAAAGEPERITGLLEATARLLLDWANTCTVTPTLDEDVTRLHFSRLVLNRAAIIVLATGLRLLGVSAPERM